MTVTVDLAGKTLETIKRQGIQVMIAAEDQDALPYPDRWQLSQAIGDIYDRTRKNEGTTLCFGEWKDVIRNGKECYER